MIHRGDLFNVLPTLDAESVDACVTDPPYGIGFMGKQWDTFNPDKARASKKHAITVGLKGRRDDNPNLRGRRQSPAMSPSQIEYDYSTSGLRGFQEWTEQWAREVLRVLKPGAYLVVCGAPRSYHRMACGIEDAGFEIRDSLRELLVRSAEFGALWDTLVGEQRELLARVLSSWDDGLAWVFGQGFPKSLNLGDGRGTALKPAYEPIVLARKPFRDTVADNILKHGTGALNIDACRIDGVPPSVPQPAFNTPTGRTYGMKTGEGRNGEMSQSDLGRWPANVVLDEEAARLLDEMTGELVDGVAVNRNRTEDNRTSWYGTRRSQVGEDVGYGGRGGASRFYYVAKPSREERDYGYERIRNIHPTVKPVELMRWLVRLVTPINGTVLDPFCGSGTTGMACRYELRRFIGIEREPEYADIAERRIAAVAPLFAEGMP